MIHCHLLPHMVWGMNTVSSHAVANNSSSGKKILMQPLQAWVMGNQSEVLGLIDRPGVEGYLAYGGSVVGNETHPPDVIEFFELSDWVSDWRKEQKGDAAPK